jgi:antitoxin FitA
MNKHVQIRNMPEAKHRKLKARAAERGMTITDYVKGLVDRDLDRPTHAELVARAKKLSQVNIGTSSVDFVREDRDSR